MAISLGGFSGGGGASTDTLDDVTTRGATTTNTITVGGVSIGTEYSLPTADGSANQVLQSDGNGNVSFQTLDFTGGLEYKGAFNATTGLPSLANAEKGDYYKISTGGTIYGQTWDVNDSLLINEDMGGTITNSKIDKIDNTEPTNVLITTNNLSDLDNASTARTNLGVAIGSDVQAYDSQLTDIAGLSPTDSAFIVGSGSNFIVESGATARASLGLGTASTEDHGTTTGDLVILEDVSGVAGLPAVDGSQLLNLPSGSDTLDDVTTRGATTTNAINVGTITTSGDILADADASRTIGAEATRFITYHGDMNGAIRFKAKNNQGSAITKGQVVYISGVSGTVPEVKLAQANSASTMPAFGLALANANDQAEVQIITFGNLTDYNTTTYSLSANDTVFVSATTAGALTNSAPTGESNLIQNIGRVVRADASAGIIKVGGAGRSNATPNLDQDKVFLGNASNQSVSTALSAIGLSKFNNDSNFLTNINSESLNDLSDVSYTAGSGIDNYVLTYDHSTTSWGAEAVASGGYPVQTATSSVTADLNSAVYLTAGSATACTVTLPATSGATDGDAVIIVRRSPGSLTIQQNGADSGTLVTYLDQGNASSHTITNNQQQIHVRYDSSGTRWYIYDRAQALVATTGDYDDLSNLPTLGTASASATTDFLSATGADTLGGNLDVGTSDIVSSSNNNIEFSANGTGVVKVKPTTSGGHLELDGDGTNVGKLRLMCEQSSHGIYLTGPSHSASASYTLKFPDTAGTANYVLKTDGSGNLDWVAQASGGGNPPTVTSASPSANYTISTHADNEEIYILTPSADISVFLPSASSCGSGYKYQIKNMASANTLTIDPNSTETIDGSTTFVIDTQYSSVTLVTDGSNWFII